MADYDIDNSNTDESPDTDDQELQKKKKPTSVGVLRDSGMPPTPQAPAAIAAPSEEVPEAGEDTEDETDVTSENYNPTAASVAAPAAAGTPPPKEIADQVAGKVPGESPTEAATKGKMAAAGSTLDKGVKSGDRDLMQEGINELDALQRDPKYKAATPPDVKQTIQDAIDKAKGLYDERVQANQWGEVFQIVGRAIAQFGAAQHGIHAHQNMVLDMGPGVNFEKRNDRAWEQYVHTLNEQKALGEETNRQYTEEEANKQREYGRKEQGINEKIRMAAEQRREDLANNREDTRDRRLQIQDLVQQEKEGTKKLQAGQALANELNQEGDLSGKTVKQLEAKMGPLAAQAGVDLNEVKTKLSGATKPGTFYGTNPDPDKQRQVLADMVTQIKQNLADVHKQKQDLINRQNPLPGGGGATAPTPAAAQTNTAPPPATIRVRGPSGQEADMTPDKAQKYLSQPGYSKVQ